MLPVPKRFNEYCTKVAAYLRAREANLLRGRTDQLQALDRTTDLDLLKKWSWLSAIVGGLFSCLGLPLLLTIIGHFLPLVLLQLFYAVMKVCIGLTCAMFALAAYFTFFAEADPNEGG
jgi:hypothetical protein